MAGVGRKPNASMSPGAGSSAKSSLFFRRKTPLLRLELFSFGPPKRTLPANRRNLALLLADAR